MEKRQLPKIVISSDRKSATIYPIQANFPIRRLSADNELDLQGLIMWYLSDSPRANIVPFQAWVSNSEETCSVLVEAA